MSNYKSIGLGLGLAATVLLLVKWCNPDTPSSTVSQMDQTDPMVSHYKNQAEHIRDLAQQIQQSSRSMPDETE